MVSVSWVFGGELNEMMLRELAHCPVGQLFHLSRGVRAAVTNLDPRRHPRR